MAFINNIVDLTAKDGISVVTINSPPVNALSQAVRDGLTEATMRAEADTQTKAIVLICDGPTFIAGADISEFGSKATGKTLQDVQAVMDGAHKPIIAAIHGTALGGGLEVAMCAHYRIACTSAQFGLPEVNLGLIPGAGGTQRLPRLVGVERALEMITTGKPIAATEALQYGLLDRVVAPDTLRVATLNFARELIQASAPIRRTRDLQEKLNASSQTPVFSDFLSRTQFKGSKAPGEAVRCVEASVRLSFDDGIAFERKVFEALKTSPESVAQRYSFFAQRKAAKIPDLEATTPTLPIAKVGIVGAGTMGSGIAMAFANSGIAVTLVETDSSRLERALENIKTTYDLGTARGRITAEQGRERFSKISGAIDLSRLADCDLAIEAVFEQMEVKAGVLRALDGIMPKTAILASNTSYLNIDALAANTSRPEYVLGLHFFSPANVMKLLEIVRGEKTSKIVMATALKLAKTLGKVPVVVGVGPGFVGNRLLAQRTKEAQKLVLEGAMPWTVDRVLTDFGFPMGPFRMSDLAGLDLGWIRSESKSETLRERLNEIGRHGQKSGAGYYDYGSNLKGDPSKITDAIIHDLQAKLGIKPKAHTDQEILERCVFPMINEAANILMEGKAIRASDIDVVWLNGYGWPSYRGGPVYYADQLGLSVVLEGVKRYGWAPSPLLERLVIEGKSFADLPPGAQG